MLLPPFEPHFLEPCPSSSPYNSPPPRPFLYLLSLCEYFALLMPLVRDARDWALIVCTQCGCSGMRLLGVWCAVIGVWLLTPASRLHVCLSFCSVTPDWVSTPPPPQLTHADTHILSHIQFTTSYAAQKSNYLSSTLHHCPLIPSVQEVDMRP